MPAGNYLIRVIINGYFVPFYQYVFVDRADISVIIKLMKINYYFKILFKKKQR